MTNETRLFIVDDNRLVREGIASLLASEPDMRVVGCAPFDSGALRIIEELRPDIVLADASSPSRCGIPLARVITQRYSGVKVVVMGLDENGNAVTDSVEAGAAGYILLQASVEEFVHVIRSVAQDEVLVSPKVAARLFSRITELASCRYHSQRSPGTKLTPREIEVLGLVAESLTNKEIAARLNVETQTVKNHVHNILEKLELGHRFEAVQYAKEAGILRK